MSEIFSYMQKFKGVWWRAITVYLLIVCCSHAAEAVVPIELDTKDRRMTKIVLLAGEPSSKPGQHEYFADSVLMMNWLKQTPGVWPVLARTWPTNEAIFETRSAWSC